MTNKKEHNNITHIKANIKLIPRRGIRIGVSCFAVKGATTILRSQVLST